MLETNNCNPLAARHKIDFPSFDDGINAIVPLFTHRVMGPARGGPFDF